MPATVTTPEDLQPLEGALNLLTSRVVALELAPPNPAIAQLQAAVAALDVRVKALEAPTPPPPPPPPKTELKLELVGGWRLVGSYATGQTGIDHATMRAWINNSEEQAKLIQYQLPPRGEGTDVTKWPIVSGTIVPGWWTGGFANGIRFGNGKVWVMPKVHYDGAPPGTMSEVAQDGETKVINLPRQQFSGYVKSANGYEYGCGGYNSGGGWCKGPSLAGLDGTVKIFYSQYATWEQACQREPNYWPKSGNDSWVCWCPRKDGVKVPVPITDFTGLQGRWASDRIRGGGLRFSHGVYYWVQCGTGELYYDRQSETFGDAKLDTCYLYHFDPVTYKLKGWKEWGKKIVCGQEISPDGRYVYLTVRHAWKAPSSLYSVDPIIEVYEVK